MVQNKNQQKPPPMFAKGQIIEIFFKLDEFWKKFSHFSPKSIGQTEKRDTTIVMAKCRCLRSC